MCSNFDIYKAYYELIKIANRIDDTRKAFNTWQEYEKAVNQVIDIEKLSKCLNASKTRLLREWYEFILLNVGLYLSSNRYNASFSRLLSLYGYQLALPRTNRNQDLDQFSTPLPVAFLLGAWASHNIAFREKRQHYVLDPTAGNGLLMIYYLSLLREKRNINIYLNEIDEVRFNNLGMLVEFNKLNNVELSNEDFIYFITTIDKKFDAILINPPFFRVKNPFTVYYPEGSIKFYSQDFAFVLKTLEKLHPYGRAVCIIGGHKFGEIEQSTYWDKQGKPKSGEERVFWMLLYRLYNVVDVIYVNGKELWQKQGQATNLRIILIDGKRQKYNKKIYPPLYNPHFDKLLNNYVELYLRLQDTEYNIFQLLEEIQIYENEL